MVGIPIPSNKYINGPKFKNANNLLTGICMNIIGIVILPRKRRTYLNNFVTLYFCIQYTALTITIPKAHGIITAETNSL